MYSLVLMTALSTGPATPQFDGFFRDLFRGGCNGSCTGRDAARSGSSCQGSCHGCNGGLFNGRIRNFFSNLFDGGSCSGCNGSCHGRRRDPLPTAARPYDRGFDPVYAGGGCTGGGIAYGCGGCIGSAPLYLGSCFGSTPNSSCFGSGAGGYLPPVSVPGVPFGDYAAPQSAGFGTGGCDCVPTAGGGVLPQLNTPLPASPVYPGGLPQDYPTIPSPGLPTPPTRIPDGFDNPAQPRPAEGGGMTSRKQPVDDDAGRGQVLVKLPLDAKLFVEGRPLSVTNGERVFVTPPLPADREAVYSFKVEWTRDGDTLSHTKKVRVRAGVKVVADFMELTSSSVKAPPPADRPAVPVADPHTTAKPADPRTGEVPTLKPPPDLQVAKITVKLPAGATLFVNGGKNDRTELVREFTTPTLTPGKVYRYTMRAELPRNGLPEYQESKVEFKAGDALTVDFTSLADPPADRRAANRFGYFFPNASSNSFFVAAQLCSSASLSYFMPSIFLASASFTVKLWTAPLYSRKSRLTLASAICFLNAAMASAGMNLSSAPWFTSTFAVMAFASSSFNLGRAAWKVDTAFTPVPLAASCNAVVPPKQ